MAQSARRVRFAIICRQPLQWCGDRKHMSSSASPSPTYHSRAVQPWPQGSEPAASAKQPLGDRNDDEVLVVTIPYSVMPYYAFRCCCALRVVRLLSSLLGQGGLDLAGQAGAFDHCWRHRRGARCSRQLFRHRRCAGFRLATSGVNYGCAGKIPSRRAQVQTGLQDPTGSKTIDRSQLPGCTYKLKLGELSKHASIHNKSTRVNKQTD